MFMAVHGQSSFLLELFVQVFFKLIDLMGCGVDCSLADVQFARGGMAGGANLSLLARSRGWSCSSLEKLVRRIKHGESGTRKHRTSRVHTDVVDRMEEDIQTNPRQSWADLAVKYERSRYTIRRKLSDRGFHTYTRCKTLKCKTVHDEKRFAFAQIMYARLLSGTGKTRVRQKVHLLRLDNIVFSDEKRFRFGESTELQSAYESPPKARLETKHGRSRM